MHDDDAKVRVGAARDEHDRAVLERILQESFGSEDAPWTPWMARVGHENLRVVRDGHAIVGGLGFYRFGQHWGGASVPMFGVAGVGVSPAARGRGIARTLLTRTLVDARAEGVPLAALFASSATVYRSIGFEQAGTVLRWEAPLASLPRGDHALACEPFDPADAPWMRALYEARARRWNGHLARNQEIWARVARPHEGIVRGYRFGPPHAPEGYVVYAHTPGRGLHFAVTLRDLVLTTPAAARRCLALLSDLRSLGSEVHWLGCAADPLVSLLPEMTARASGIHRWMLRIVDPVAALGARGYGRDGEARVLVRDAVLGDAALHVRARDGRAEAVAIDPARAKVAVDVRALAALYSGFTTIFTLRAMGLLEGPDEDAFALQSLFAAEEPWLCDWF